MLFGLSGLTAKSDSLRSLWGSVSTVTWTFPRRVMVTWDMQNSGKWVEREGILGKKEGQGGRAGAPGTALHRPTFEAVATPRCRVGRQSSFDVVVPPEGQVREPFALSDTR